MNTQEKAAGVVTTPTTAQSKASSSNFPTIRRFAKALIVVFALRGWLPYPIAGWILQRGGLAHV